MYNVKKTGVGKRAAYSVTKGGQTVKIYTVKDYPKFGTNGARDMAQNHARRLNGGRSLGGREMPPF